jgi:nitrogen fixation-related uncharacterized protein
MSRWWNLEKGVILGALALLAGLALLTQLFWSWGSSGFGDLDYPHTLRRAIPGATLTALGFQTMLAGFFTGILGMKRR